MDNKRIFHGVDVKRFQYEEYATNFSDKKIDIKELIQNNLFDKTPIEINCIMINLEKDHQRYSNTIEEFKKIGINNFSHLKATYWKDKERVCEDLTFVLDFLKQFIPEIESKKIFMDEFSFLNDSNIHIQDGPLACYISHLRSMIYGYSNFDNYTIICEDDISIANTELIEQYLQEIPDDWDIVMLNACSKNKIYDSIMYKFDEDFHSTHFYIINHKAFPTLFSGMYPITDQVDVLISQLRNKLNIYNIQETVYQKNISTNTQNNLYTIFNSPHYDSIRENIKEMEDSLLGLANMILEENETRNNIIVQDLIYDVFWNYVLYFEPNEKSIEENNKENYEIDLKPYSDYADFDKLMNNMRFILQCSKKGISGDEVALSLMRVFLFTLERFSLHNKDIKAYGFGSTSHTYLSNDKIIKRYNDKLRWLASGHDNSRDIFQKELRILTHLQSFFNLSPSLISYSEEQKEIVMSYCGESLWDTFKLPYGWENQITILFTQLDNAKIYYPEFRLQNILIKNEKITFIDYGLATFDGRNNKGNCQKFIQYLTKLEDKLKNVENRNTRLQLITTFFSNEGI
jgi:predicted Ser/Thr protein kinase/GR25 family glycosyltransferase involved in LPS biosynthesis